MNNKEPRISVILTQSDKQLVDAYCHEMDITVSQLVRRLLKAHFKDYQHEEDIPTFD
jgi:hypothetical protein